MASFVAKKAKLPCRNWTRSGTCTWGAKCHFRHDGFVPSKTTSTQFDFDDGLTAQMTTLSLNRHQYGHDRIEVRDDAGNAERFTVEQINARLVFSCALDTSASMGGTRTEQAIAGLKHIVANAMRPIDYFGLFTFETNVKKCFYPMQVKKIDMVKAEQYMRANAGGCTALYDAMAASKKCLAVTYKKLVEWKVIKEGEDIVINEQLVITDGQNNTGKTSLDEIKKLVAEPGMPNYNLCVVAVGIDDTTASVMEAICTPKHCHFWRVKDAAELAARLQKVADRVRLTLETINGKTGKREKIRWEGERGDAGKGMLAMAEHAPLLVQALQNAPALKDQMRNLLGM